ncbi:ComEC/Rec2 family competence protein [Planctomicrobium sp. SH527]|uniref:ComEC/Rec2 family competence protein n=1 Tax=Planctomicrobium sp. SH527 TaxID=3448123 RepID=UPI003F5B872C
MQSEQFPSQQLQIIRQHPAQVVVLCFASGIAFDRFFSIPLAGWLGTATIGYALAAWCWRSRSTAVTALLLLTLFALGGTRHYLSWQSDSPNDVVHLTTVDPQVVRIVGVVTKPLEIFDRPTGPHIPPWLGVDRSTGFLRCEQIQHGNDWRTATGVLRIDVMGRLDHVQVGDRINVLGQLSQPASPMNPGEFQYADSLRSQGAGCRLRVKHTANVQVVGQENSLAAWLAKRRTAIRNQCRLNLAAVLPPASQALAASLLLGDRTQLPDELKNQFAETGMMHLLAVSGINVGILLAIVLGIGRTLNLGSRQLAIAMIGAAILFMWITDHQPSVIRAGLLAIFGLVASLFGRPSQGMNTLAVCALILILWHPPDIFDIGAQLSFLAVIAILQASRVPLADYWRNRLAYVEPQTRFAQLRESIFLGLAKMYFVTGTIWIVTLPLIIYTFHLVTPIGLLMDLFLVPVATVVLGMGYVFLCVSMVSSWAGAIIGLPFSWGLTAMQSAVAWGQNVPLGHFFVSSIPSWWVIGFYLIAALVWLRIPAWRGWGWGTRIWPVWMMIGLAIPWLSPSVTSLRCTVLSVGHGLACVLELPSGETVIYDTGTLGDGRRAARTVERYLRSRGKRVIDAMILSHADHDHFSGMFELFHRFPIPQLFATQQSAQSRQPGVKELWNLAQRSGSHVQLLQTADQLHSARSGSDVRLLVLHPSRPAVKVSDNSQSLAIAVEYAGRRILLTGDIELQGIDALLTQPPMKCDVVLSPHHGAKVSNIPPLYDWCSPDFVIVSAATADIPHLEFIKKFSQLLSTASSGAITIEIRQDGTLQVLPFRSNLN